MDTLNIKYTNALQSLETLSTALNSYEKRNQIEDTPLFSAEDQILFLRDSVIKRFEYTLDTTWKYLKEYLRVNHGTDIGSPKPIFRECKKTGLINDAETELALEMVDARNLTSHTYKEEVAEIIIASADEYRDLLEKLLKLSAPQ